MLLALARYLKFEQIENDRQSLSVMDLLHHYLIVIKYGASVIFFLVMLDDTL